MQRNGQRVGVSRRGAGSLDREHRLPCGAPSPLLAAAPPTAPPQKAATVVFLDSPAGVGLSYSETPRDYNTNDTQTAADTEVFLRRFFQRYPELGDLDFYITGESYAGGWLCWRVRAGGALGGAAGLPVTNHRAGARDRGRAPAQPRFAVPPHTHRCPALPPPTTRHLRPQRGARRGGGQPQGPQALDQHPGVCGTPLAASLVHAPRRPPCPSSRARSSACAHRTPSNAW